MFNWLKKLTRKPSGGEGPLRAVPGAGTCRGTDGKVIYNMLDPMMQQFLGRCVGAVKKAGIRAKRDGTVLDLAG